MVAGQEFAATRVEMPLHDPPDTAEIRAALDRVLASGELRAAAQLAAFLRHIVEETFAGRADRIKAYSIGVEALGRPEAFDPQRDPIVRVEANRLRQALAAYYAGSGADDDIIMDIPRGRYVPCFRRRAGGDTPAAARSWVRRRPVSAALAGLAVAVAVALAALAGALVWLRMGDDSGPATALQVPVLVVDGVQPTSAAAEPLASAISRELVTVFSYVQSVAVVTGPAPAPAAEAAPAGSVRGFRLGGRLDTGADGGVTVTLNLDYDGIIAWTREWRLAAGAEADLAGIARETAMEVGRIFGVMYARVRADAQRLGPGYRCLLMAADSLRRFDVTQHLRVRDCLERTTAENPDFALAFGLLAFVYEREYLHDLPRRPGDKDPLELSLAATRRMLALWSDSAIAQVALMENLYLRGDLAGAFAAGDKAIAFNPIDSTVSGMVGLRRFLGGDTERGAALLQKSAAVFGSNPAPIEFGLFLVAYMAGDMRAAARHAFDEETSFPYGLAAQALVAAANGEHARARRAHDRLIEIHPGWAKPRTMLERFIRAPEILDRLAADLAAVAAR